MGLEVRICFNCNEEAASKGCLGTKTSDQKCFKDVMFDKRMFDKKIARNGML